MEISDRLRSLGLKPAVLQGKQPLEFLETQSLHDAQSIWNVYGMNIALSECKAAQMLLNEVSESVARYTKFLQDSLSVLKSQPSSTKEKRSLKTTARICGVASIVLYFHTLAVHLCLLMRDASKNKSTRSDCVKAVERTRMVLSTFDSYLMKNLDRSLKSLSQYLCGKAIKNVMSDDEFCH